MGAKSSDNGPKGVGNNKRLDQHLVEYFSTKRTSGISTNYVPPLPSVNATGGTITTWNDYTIHSFPGGSLDSSNPYTFTIPANATPIIPSTNFDIILVAGGGTGGDDQPGSYGGGGGGAGGVRFIPQISLPVGSYPIGVGGGAAAAADGAQGQPTVFNAPNGNGVPSITVHGGGYGGAGGGGGGGNGGCGGGKDYPGPTSQFGAGNNGAGNSPEPRASGPTSPIGDTRFQGSPGNATATDTSYSGGGGGGARYSPPTYYSSPIPGPGITVPAPAASFRAQGGDGIDFSPIIGPRATNGFGDSNYPTEAWFGGGGHGGQYPGGTGAPGTGGKGGGGGAPQPSKNGQPNTGGGGAVYQGNGGPGIVLIRYKNTGGSTGS
jgi:hypothetical protein